MQRASTRCATARKSTIDLTENDLVFITNGGCVENSSIGDQNTPAKFNTEIQARAAAGICGAKLPRRTPSFGHPDKFCSDPEQTNWMSATVETLDERIIPYIKNICKRDPFTGKVVTGGIVSVKDSSWLLSWTINRQPQFKAQPKGHCLVWVYGLFSDKPGDYVKKPMRECTGKEICMEWLYHIGVPEDQIEDLARDERQHRAVHDAVYHRILHASRIRRPPGRCACGRCELRVPRSVRRDDARHHLHDGILHAYRHGGRIHAAERRPRRAGGLGQRIRFTRTT